MLQSLCIYNPDLEPDEDHVADQIVFFYSKKPVDEDYKVRHIGLVQGVMEFSRGFADGQPVTHIDTSRRRVVVTELERNTNWWISLCVSQVSGPSTNTAGFDKIDPLYLEQNLSSPEIMISQLKSAYRRWKMHYGKLSDLYLKSGRMAVVELLEPWFNAWCSNWTPTYSGDGVIDLYADKTRMAKSHLTEQTVEVLASVLEKERDKGLVDMLVTIHDADKAEYDGCIFQGQDRLSENSINDLVRWITECHKCGKNEDSAFLESSGFTDHLNVHVELDASFRSSSSVSLVQTPLTKPKNSTGILSPESRPHSRAGTPDIVANDADVSSIDSVSTPVKTTTMSSMFFPSSVNMTNMTSININYNPMPALGSALSSISKASYGAVDIVKDMSLKSLSAFQHSPAAADMMKNDLADSAPSDDVSASRFLIGLKGYLSDGPESHFADGEDGEDFFSNTEITTKQLFIHLRDSPDGSDPEDISVKCNVVIYQREPFIFALFYKPGSPQLASPDFYKTLHLRLASISEPIYNDLSLYAAAPSTTPAFRFYYLVIDASRNILQTSLPSIPDLPNAELHPDANQHAVESLFAERFEMLHIHRSIVQLISKIQPYEQEKFIRTAYNWWIYWSKVDDDRTVIFAKRWSRSGKAPSESSALLGAIGKDVKIWLDNYKVHGKV